MKKMFLLFSHQLSEEQKNDAKENFGVDEFVSLPDELQKQWSNFDPDSSALELKPFRDFLKMYAHIGDIVLIQGDFGATFNVANFVIDFGLVPVYATTKREISEVVENGIAVKKSIFKHRRFREYGNN